MVLVLVKGLFLILVFLNAWTTRVVIRDDLSSQTQRTAQILFVWLMPFLGALLTLHMKRADSEASEGRYRDNPDPGDDFGVSHLRYHGRETPSEVDGTTFGDGGASD